MPQLGIDFEREVIKWAKLIFEVTKTKEQGKIDKEALQFNVNWKYVNFDHTEPIYDDVTKPTEPKSQVVHTCNSDHRYPWLKMLQSNQI